MQSPGACLCIIHSKQMLAALRNKSASVLLVLRRAAGVTDCREIERKLPSGK